MDDKICVKISVYNGCWVEEVVYYRYKLPLWLVEKWKWYFEYLAARIKVKNPRRKVELLIVACETPCGEDYISEHAQIRAADTAGEGGSPIKKTCFFEK